MSEPLTVLETATGPASIPSALDFGAQMKALADAAPGWGAELTAATAQAFSSGDTAWPVALMVMLVAGFAGERLACWKLYSLSNRIESQQSTQWTVVLGYAILRVLFDLVGVVLFGLFATVALYLLVDSDLGVYGTLEHVVLAIVSVRASLLVARAIFAPHAGGIRPFALANEDAKTFYRWVGLFVSTYAVLAFIEGAIFANEMTPVLHRATNLLLGLSLIAIILAFVWTNRQRLERLFAPSLDAATSPSAVRQILSQSWPYVMTAWFMMLWASWAYAGITADAQRNQATLISWWITLLFPIGDRLFNSLLHALTAAEFLKDTGFDARRARFISNVQTCVRFILGAVALFALALTWNLLGQGLVATDWGQRIIWSAIDIGVTILFAYVLYELVMALLEKHMPDEASEEDESEGEIGGTGATRQETLAPLLRSVFLVTLALVVVLSVLSLLGVQILPLLAGASIVGIAIGFGSQKLVQDIISGVFFLIDDAFRRGEYIDLGEIKGTVEKISIRSMQLRHHMGALHTIPFGEIRHLTNFSRDWVMMKLKLRLTYGTDLEKVRKLIKKLGQRLLEDEEIGDLFLQPLKSQGVYSMEDDSAMIIRVKFMTRPGDQFVVRKTVYAQLRELFEREGIEFAHRVVSVRIDSAAPDTLGPDEQRAVAGAALAAKSETA